MSNKIVYEHKVKSFFARVSVVKVKQTISHRYQVDLSKTRAGKFKRRLSIQKRCNLCGEHFWQGKAPCLSKELCHYDDLPF